MNKAESSALALGEGITQMNRVQPSAPEILSQGARMARA